MQKVAKMKLMVLLILPREGLKKTGYVITEDSRYISFTQHLQSWVPLSDQDSVGRR